jgi:hypothetical protein
MRIPSRSLAACLLAIGAASCTDTRSIDSPIPAGKHAARIELNPVFSESAQTIAASIADFGITFDHVRIAIRDNPDTTRLVVDTTIAFGSTSAALTLDLTVPVDVDGQIFNALVQYIGPSGVVYSGTILVQSHPADQPAPEQQNLVLRFVGPGATLKTLTFAPKPVNLLGSQSVPVTVTAKDSTGATIAVPPLVFTSSDASVAKITGTTNLAVQSFGKRGTARLIAVTPIGISDTLSAIVTLPAAAITLVSGGGQTGVVGTALANPAVVQVNAADGIGVAGVAVTFAPPIGGSVGTTTATTDANGRASTTLTLATGVGAQSFLATAAGFNQPIPATATAGPASAATSTISSNVTQLNADNTSSATITVQARDQYGNVATAGGATVTLTTSLGHFGSAGAATTVTATDIGNGTYTATLFSAQSGTATITGTVAGTAIATPAVTINLIAALLDHFEITRADGSSLAPSVPAGTPIAVKVTARDKSNNVVTGYTGQPKMRVVNSFFTPDSVVLAPAAVAGVTVVNLTFSQPNTNVDITATATIGQATLTTASVAFAVVTGPASQIIAIGQGEVVFNEWDSTPTNYPAIQVTDAAGNAIAGQAVSFQFTTVNTETGAPQCSFPGATTFTTNSAGVISFDATSLNYAAASRGPYSCLLIAQATANAQPLPPLFVGLVVRQSGNPTWTGKAHDSRWTTAGNWDGGIVPTSSSSVFLPLATTILSSNLQAPKLAANQAVGTIEVEDGGQLDLGGNTLTVGGTINGHIAGTIFNGTVATAVANNGGSMSGLLPNVSCTSGEYSLSNATIVHGDFANSGCQLFFNSWSMAVTGNFTQTNTGVIGMSTPNDLLDISGDALFSGGPETDLLSGGVIIARGNLTQSGGASSFATSLLQNTQMSNGGTSTHALNFASPTSSKFTTLALVIGQSSALNIQSAIQVDSALSIVTQGVGGSLSLQNGMANTTNGTITITAQGLTANLGGTINTRRLIFNTGTSVTLNGSGNLSLGNGFLEFRTNAHVTINVSGTVFAAGCTRQSGVVIDGSNTTAINALAAQCRVVP